MCFGQIGNPKLTVGVSVNGCLSLAKGCPLRRGSATQPLETKATLVETRGHNGVAGWRPQVDRWPPTQRKSWSWQPGLQRMIWLWTSRKLASYWHQEAPTPPSHQRRVCEDGPHLPLSQHPDLRSDNITAGIKQAQKTVLGKHSPASNLLLTEISGCSPPSLMDIYTYRCLSRATPVCSDSSHPSFKLPHLLPSGMRFRCIRTKTYDDKSFFSLRRIITAVQYLIMCNNFISHCITPFFWKTYEMSWTVHLYPHLSHCYYVVMILTWCFCAARRSYFDSQ